MFFGTTFILLTSVQFDYLRFKRQVMNQLHSWTTHRTQRSVVQRSVKTTWPPERPFWFLVPSSWVQLVENQHRTTTEWHMTAECRQKTNQCALDSTFAAGECKPGNSMFACCFECDCALLSLRMISDTCLVRLLVCGEWFANSLSTAGLLARCQHCWLAYYWLSISGSCSFNWPINIWSVQGLT